ncbi:hypothetical protein HBI56_066390 [Parastagonospora nodorum]|uniref:CUE domain-containing protein n=1 Tax=Phaeosphaeria nodorum (strain SN15 / ATCC MYA-4574 / FGSC 10173) TaxID=321614 RepID=A0A7U2HSD6_PHANO|nr:hypothetical protein HBH56_000980 [Parastagonospora nodorum]QRC90090.1 hypothetical protein JI435_095090 [Parastagonospora nodorum SN15]KAH3938043.1 hypothetical protein HBH54_000990 [Parastagonospora nodorum]KAH3940865.1 hypothetical protein HBH53_210290 [Parastagonospora nodorum]KAH3958461.1 hypothetical protein HBH51_208820 [Parastagonospora nodorum]
MSHPDNNPWQDESSATGGNHQGYANPNPYSTYQDQTQSRDPYAADPHQGQYQPPSNPPPHQQPLSSHPPERYYGTGTTTHDDAGWGESQPYQPPPPQVQQQQQSPYAQAPPQPNHHGETPPGLPPRRSATDIALPTGQDRTHQIEVMQSYEAAGRKDEHDQNVEMLQREFPKIDGSLIAAIYGDSQSLSATREMLGELEG